jgi:hypothetical protein
MSKGDLMFDSKLWTGISLGLAAAALWQMAGAPAAAEQPARTATCVTFGLGPGSAERALEEGKPFVWVTQQVSGQFAETWVNTQLAAGKDQFFASALGPNTIVCAW